MVTEISHPQLIVVSVNVNPGGILDESLGTFENSYRRHIAARRTVENQNRISHVVGDEEFVFPGIERNSSRPIHLSLWALNHAERGGIAACGSGIDCDGRRQVLAGAWNGVGKSQRPIRFP